MRQSRLILPVHYKFIRRDASDDELTPTRAGGARCVKSGVPDVRQHKPSWLDFMMKHILPTCSDGRGLTINQQPYPPNPAGTPICSPSLERWLPARRTQRKARVSNQHVLHSTEA